MDEIDNPYRLPPPAEKKREDSDEEFDALDLIDKFFESPKWKPQSTAPATAETTPRELESFQLEDANGKPLEMEDSGVHIELISNDKISKVSSSSTTSSSRKKKILIVTRRIRRKRGIKKRIRRKLKVKRKLVTESVDEMEVVELENGSQQEEIKLKSNRKCKRRMKPRPRKRKRRTRRRRNVKKAIPEINENISSSTAQKRKRHRKRIGRKRKISDKKVSWTKILVTKRRNLPQIMVRGSQVVMVTHCPSKV